MPANSCLVTDLQFAMSCLNNSSDGVINFQAVAQQCGMPTAAAANHKLWRMKKAHPLPVNGNTTGNATTSASPASGSKGQGGGKKISKKRKPAASANEDDEEAAGSPKKCKIDNAVKAEDQEK
ncbi:hypothetical protein KC343_g1653 [Hortaea werneckii]|uniref:Myb-like DNA-binding domain-containing protein n=1 Tax=Hortaea werneckii TaxID=91943 RepID=A0A3M7HLR6_HORWE|nr:hypothetical protein KC352_g6333 [Hortaea werneckii]KAI7570903.1 hypothetical protein KC317_g2075 [Hortaea werneckii]KAI7626133.1 hypothetical protein KC346_g1423 [Hortaea werneckii]KAI7635723.1 hypothetical protein KC343_g1653 [Hortaea werneckii]KAI7681784.1 hypothetical protein KC319_g1376 [Hortaea werneckii]